MGQRGLHKKRLRIEGFSGMVSILTESGHTLTWEDSTNLTIPPHDIFPLLVYASSGLPHVSLLCVYQLCNKSPPLTFVFIPSQREFHPAFFSCVNLLFSFLVQDPHTYTRSQLSSIFFDLSFVCILKLSNDSCVLECLR